MQSPISNPILIFEVSKSKVAIRGDVSSAAHSSILRQQALALFPEKTTAFDLTEKPALPAGWALISEITLWAITSTYSSITEIRPDSISISGMTANQVTWQESITRMKKHLLPGMQLNQKVEAVGSPISHSKLCERILVNATRDAKIEFTISSATLRSSALPALDKLIQLMTDCPLKTIRIAGHTDSTGESASNLAVSLARAESVSAYLVGRGIHADRIAVRGAGYTEPLDTAESYRAHQINRRIEIEIKSPDAD